MSYEPADHEVEFRRTDRATRGLIAVLIIASAVAACTGGASLDIPVGPVDHGCHASTGYVPGGDGSGCS